MATIDTVRELEPDSRAPIGWDGQTLKRDARRLRGSCSRRPATTTASSDLEMKESDPLHFEKLFSRVRGGMVTARETALNISASPIVRELGRDLLRALHARGRQRRALDRASSSTSTR